MSAYMGPAIPTSSLIFHYDMLNTNKSWKGQPTTNYFTTLSGATNGDVTFPVTGTGTFQRVTTGTYGDYTVDGTNDVVYRYNLGLTGCHFHGFDIPITVGQAATFSCDFYISPDVTSYPTVNQLLTPENAFGGSTSDPTPTIRGTWKSTSTTGTAGTTTLRALIYPGGCSNSYLAASGYVLFRNPQVTFTSYRVPFVSGTRSNTQALLDTTGRNTITVNSLSYSSNNTFSLNGSGYIETSAIAGTGNSAGNLTWACWVSAAATSGDILNMVGSGWNMCPFYATGQTFYARVWGSNAMSAGSTYTLNQYYHLALVRNNSTSTNTFYVNGVAVATQTGASYAASGIDNQHFWGRAGAQATNTNFNGSIPSAQVYNTALSASEVGQLFAAQRSKYGV